MLQIGLTGGIACGKSTVSDLFASYNIPVIDADVVAREVVKPGSRCLDKIVAYFGNSILNDDKTLDRANLRKRLFSDASAKVFLESVLHPEIRHKMDYLASRALKNNTPYCIKVVPLLIETQQENSVDRILVVDCDSNTQLNRLIARDNTSLADAQKILDAQLSREERLAYADDVIENTHDLDSLQPRVLELHQRYLQASKEASKAT